jgi:hypothetical protein
MAASVKRPRDTDCDKHEAALQQYEFFVKLAEVLRPFVANLPTPLDWLEGPVVRLSNLLSCSDFNTAHAELVYASVSKIDLNYDQYLNGKARHIKQELQKVIATATLIRANWLQQQGNAPRPSATQHQKDCILDCYNSCVDLLRLSHQFVVAMKDGLVKMACDAGRNATVRCIADAHAKFVADAAAVESELIELKQRYDGASDNEIGELIKDSRHHCGPTQDHCFGMARTHGGLADLIFKAGKDAADPFDRLIDKMDMEEELFGRVKTAMVLPGPSSPIADSDSEDDGSV